MSGDVNQIFLEKNGWTICSLDPDLGLHYLPITLLGVSSLQQVKGKKEGILKSNKQTKKWLFEHLEAWQTTVNKCSV